MAYETKIAQTETPQFAEIYETTIGATKNYYTSHIKNVSYGGNIYYAVPLKRSEFSFTKQLRSIQCRITTTISELMKSYIANAPSENVRVKITRVFLDESGDAIEIFNGEVISVTIAENAASVVLEASNAIFKNKIPKIVYQARCNWMLFDGNCGLSEPSWEVNAIVSLDGSDLVSPTFAGYTNGYFIQGHVKVGTDYRMITNHVGDRITLQLPFDARLEEGGLVTVWPGCDKAAATCKTKFNNFDNFVGFPYIPSSNPVLWGF